MLTNPFVQVRSPAVAPSSFTFATLPSATSVAPRQAFFVSDVGVNGSWWYSNGTKWAPINGSVVLLQASTPFIFLSSGSLTAGGAISGITALPILYPKAWCYFPANAVATVAAAGWRYCTFSTTTAGVAFLDQPGATFPVIWPAAPTAVTDGKGAFTSPATTRVDLPTITVPGGSMGKNGRLFAKALATVTASANYKYFGLGIGSDGDTIRQTQAGSLVYANLELVMQNSGSESAQVNNVSLSTALGSSNNTASMTSSFATASDFTAFLDINKQTSAENAVYESFTITLLNDGQ